MKPVSNANGILSAPVSVSLTRNGENIVKTCQRVLTVRNNVAIDVVGCRPNPGDVGVDVTNRIAGKVGKQ
ncbi:sensor domain-containing protein [Mycobacterium genavense]|uniref:sensor domain-containing protein n=1 Tax=Mycobacterium genavense TaxID=36812 RepID=UPI0004ACFB4A|nr:sensor domain-containing protein [Mycobacterium genavense]